MNNNLTETILVDKAHHSEGALLASDVMTKTLQSTQANWSLRELASFFMEHKISGAPVQDESGHWIGVVTVTDLARHEQFTNYQDSLEDVHKLYDVFIGQQYMPNDEVILARLAHSSHTVKSIMTPKIFSVHTGAKASDVAKAMVKQGVHRVLVTDSENLVGIISSLDLLHAFSDRI